MKGFFFILYAAGFYLAYTYDDLSFLKYATQSHTYNGNLELFGANRAVDRNISTCTRTDDIGPTAANKKLWWRVDIGGVYNIYSINILFRDYGKSDEQRQRGRFAGFSILVSNTGNVSDSTLCYKDGPNLPPLNFTTICTQYGRYVFFYNERLNGVTYPELISITELCEIVVKGCSKVGVYGTLCNQICPTYCRDNICNILNGTCYGCLTGWTGVTCNSKCKEGWYGDNCGRSCLGHCRDNTTCNHVTGQCDKGCQAGWTGTLCAKECNEGTYGLNCTKNCSGHCLNNSPCNKQTGRCDRGCNPGYTNDDCGKQCSHGFFGTQCKEHCRGHCMNNESCSHVSGTCSRGCQDGYTGEYCNNSCKFGYYGQNCSRICSVNCKTCQHTDGLCSCTAGWHGFHCNKECIKSYGENCQLSCGLQCINQTCDRVNGSCLIECKDGMQCNKENTLNFLDSSSSSSNGLPAAVGGTFGAMFLVIGFVMAIFLIRLKRKSTTMAKQVSFNLDGKLHGTKQADFGSEDGHKENVGEALYALPDKTKRGPPTNKNISIRNMKAQITNMSLNENSGFKIEYQDIPRGELHPCTEGKKQENKVKNRYTTIFPYDHSRVILKTNNEVGYINANYIEDTRGRRTYIATQGPKPKTIADFWSMIWQEEVSNIVCLTNLTEGTKNKCAQYWPDVNDKLQGGILTVRHLEEKTLFIFCEILIRFQSITILFTTR